MISFGRIIKVLIGTISLKQGYASINPSSRVGQQHQQQGSTNTIIGITGTATKPSMKEVESYLHSIGYTIQNICEEYPHLSSYSSAHTHTGRFLEEETSWENKDERFYIKNGLLAFACVTIAALAAGLTMGLVSQELLDLKIKEIAGDAKEKAQAKSVLPLIKDHHRLLVTLLLINAMANEALPLFLDKIVPGYVAVILSVTLVLFFGEIIPSAIFSGPNKLAIASKLAPLVQFLLWLLCPLAFPIAKVLDKVLHEEGEGDSSMEKYDRAELSALVRLQYEERKQQQNLKSKLANFDSSSTPGQPHNTGSVRFVKHIDTVNMVEGALEMQSKIAADVMIPIDNVFSISKDLSLNEDNILEIYRSGFSRVPVHEPSDKARILGVFRTRQLIVMNPDEGRDLATLPLIKPHCVGPQMNMLNLINILQTGSTANKGGHLAIVCEDSALANLSLENDECIPSDAGVLGVVTLENCIEALIKEDIYDEYDQAEKQSLERARWAADKWIKFAKKRKQEKILLATQSANNEDADESTNLLHSLDDTIYDPTQFQFQEYLA